MLLTSIRAKEMLEEAIGKTPHDGWIYHSICVGEASGRIAEALNLDVDKAMAMGYIHDIGKAVGPFHDHIINGYNYLKELGYDSEYYNICLVHSYLNNDIECTGAGHPLDIPWRTEFIKNYEYTLYDKIVMICDLMCTSVINTVDKRLVDVIIRRGAYSNTQYHIKEVYKLKSYFDDLLGKDLYSLFPEILDNL